MNFYSEAPYQITNVVFKYKYILRNDKSSVAVIMLDKDGTAKASSTSYVTSVMSSKDDKGPFHRLGNKSYELSPFCYPPIYRNACSFSLRPNRIPSPDHS